MRIVLLLLIIAIVVVIQTKCRNHLTESLGDRQTSQTATAKLPVTVMDGLEDSINLSRTSQVASTLLFLNFWNNALSKTSANPESEFKPLVVKSDYTHLSETNTTSDPRNIQLKIAVGITPEVHIYKFNIPYQPNISILAPTGTYVQGTMEEFNEQRLVTELLCRVDVQQLYELSTKQAFVKYMRDFVETQVEAVLPLVSHTTELQQPDARIFSISLMSL